MEILLFLLFVALFLALIVVFIVKTIAPLVPYAVAIYLAFLLIQMLARFFDSLSTRHKGAVIVLAVFLISGLAIPFNGWIKVFLVVPIGGSAAIGIWLSINEANAGRDDDAAVPQPDATEADGMRNSSRPTTVSVAPDTSLDLRITINTVAEAVSTIESARRTDTEYCIAVARSLLDGPKCSPAELANLIKLRNVLEGEVKVQRVFAWALRGAPRIPRAALMSLAGHAREESAAQSLSDLSVPQLLEMVAAFQTKDEDSVRTRKRAIYELKRRPNYSALLLEIVENRNQSVASSVRVFAAAWLRKMKPNRALVSRLRELLLKVKNESRENFLLLKAIAAAVSFHGHRVEAIMSPTEWHVVSLNSSTSKARSISANIAEQ